MHPYTYDYFFKNRKNFSKEADELLEKIKNGHEPTDKEVFFLSCSEEWLNEHKDQVKLKEELDEIRNRVACGTITEKDFNRLTEICGFSREDIERLRTSFSKKGILKEEEKSNRNI